MGGDEPRSPSETRLRLTCREILELPSKDVRQLVDELQVRLVELQQENEALRLAQLEQIQCRELFDYAPVGYATLDAHGMIIRLNSVGWRVLECPSLVGPTVSLRDFVAPSDQPALDGLLKTVGPQECRTLDVRLLTEPDAASRVRLDLSFIPGRPTDLFAVLTDVSARKRSLAALAFANQDVDTGVATRNASLEAENERLVAELDDRAKLAMQHSEREARVRSTERHESLGVLAHDFNNLLVSVSGNAELLLRQADLSDSARESVVMIAKAGRLAAELTRQLLLFSGRGQLNRTAVDLPKLVAENFALLRTRVSPGIVLQMQSAAELPEIHADRALVNQLVLHLVTNAIEALQDGAGTIFVEMEARELDRGELATFQLNQFAKPGAFVVLRVRDTGPGMDVATQQRIFEPFFTTKFTGRGLGLASVSGIVQTHRGAVRVRSALREGTSIEVALCVAELRKTSERPLAGAPEPWKGSGAILLIDDDDSVRKVMADLLRMLGFDVSSAASGEAGLELCRLGAPPFKLVVLDWIMPGMSGRDVLEQLRLFEPSLPVILISGYSLEDLATYDKYSVSLQKPIMLEALRDAVRSPLAMMRPCS